MAALITWNPLNTDYNWDCYSDDCKRVLAGQDLLDTWSVGNSTSRAIPLRSRLYLLRQGQEPRGIVGSGWSRSEPYLNPESNDGRSRWIDLEFNMLIDLEKHPPLDWRKFQTGPLAAIHWKTQKSGIQVPDELENHWREHLTIIFGGEIPAIPMINEDEEFPEGRYFWGWHRQVERNQTLVQKAKAQAKKDGKLHCWACGFDFAKKYGAHGQDFIECHHTIPVMSLIESSSTKISDLAMVCSNCHRMLHRRRPWLSMKDLKSLVAPMHS